MIPTIGCYECTIIGLIVGLVIGVVLTILVSRHNPLDD